jgi:hypothetical protein
MACVTLEEIAKDCERNSGGLHEVLFGDMDSITAITEASATFSVTAMTVSEAPIDLNIKRKTSNYTDEEAQDFTNGSTTATQTINLMLHRRDATKSRALNILGAGQRYLYAIVKDANGIYWYIPNCQRQNVGEGSGTERADGSKYSVVFIAENDSLAYTISSAIVATLKAVS